MDPVPDLASAVVPSAVTPEPVDDEAAPPRRGGAALDFLRRWSLGSLLVYLLLWTLPFPFTPLAYVQRPELEPVPAACHYLVQRWQEGADAATRWFGANLYPGKDVVRVAAATSMDTKFDWLQSVTFAAVALLLGLVAALLLRRGGFLRAGYGLLRLQLRYYVAWCLFGAGAMKVIAPTPGSAHQEVLYQPFGDAAPAGLCNAFVDASPFYLQVAGWLEVLCAVLLCFRRTTLLAAVLGLGVMGHIAMLNLGYDLPAKRIALHLLAMFVVLAAPDAGRLWAVFVANRFAESAVLRPRLPLWLKAPVMGFGFLFAALLAFLAFAPQVDRALQEQGKWVLWPQGHGLWEPVAAGPWRLLWSDGVAVRVTLADGSVRSFDCAEAATEKAVALRPTGAEPSVKPTPLEFTVQDMPIDPKAPPAWLQAMPKDLFAAPPPSSLRQLTLRGELGGDKVDVVLRERPLATFLLWGRGFHWVQDRMVEGAR